MRAENLVVGYLPRLRREASDADDGETQLEPLAIARVPFLAAQRGDRIGIVGPNGAGKTTLLRTIAGDLPPLDGVVTIGMGVSIGYLAQLRDAAIPGETVLGALTSADLDHRGRGPGLPRPVPVPGRRRLQGGPELSGGERSRLELALLGIMPSNLLLLDEPTNHLDIPAREAIEAFLTDSPATLLVVSHDRRLLETVCDRLWVVDDGLAAPFDGGYRRGGQPWPGAGRSRPRSRPRPPGCTGAGRVAVRPRSARLPAVAGAARPAPAKGARGGGQARPARKACVPSAIAQAVQGRLPQAAGHGRR